TLPWLPRIWNFWPIRRARLVWAVCSCSNASNMRGVFLPPSTTFPSPWWTGAHSPGSARGNAVTSSDSPAWDAESTSGHARRHRYHGAAQPGLLWGEAFLPLTLIAIHGQITL